MTFKYSPLQIDTEARDPLIQILLGYQERKKVAIEAASQVILDNQIALERRTCERVSAKSYNYNAHATLASNVLSFK
jgi:hypothetical protein